MGAGKACCGFPKLQQRLSRTHGGSAPEKNASQSFTIGKMKLLKTKHLSENTKTNDVGNATFLHFHFFLKFHSNYADQKKCKIKVFSLMISVAFDTQGKYFFFFYANTYIDL